MVVNETLLSRRVGLKGKDNTLNRQRIGQLYVVINSMKRNNKDRVFCVIK